MSHIGCCPLFLCPWHTSLINLVLFPLNLESHTPQFCAPDCHHQVTTVDICVKTHFPALLKDMYFFSWTTWFIIKL